MRQVSKVDMPCPKIHLLHHPVPCSKLADCQSPADAFPKRVTLLAGMRAANNRPWIWAFKISWDSGDAWIMSSCRKGDMEGKVLHPLQILLSQWLTF